MQIHEITKRPLKEGLLGDIGRGFAGAAIGQNIPQGQSSINKDAMVAAKKLQAQGYGEPQPLPTPQQAVGDVQKNPAQQQYIKGLVAQWAKVAPDASTARPAVQTPPASKPQATPTDPNWRQDALKAAGATFSPGPAPATKAPPVRTGPAPKPTYGKPGQASPMPSGVATSAQGQKMLQAYGKPRGGIQDLESDLQEAPQEYTTPGGIVVPGGTKTDKTSTGPAAAVPTGNQYKESFLKWAAEKLRTVEPSTRQTITLDKVTKTDIGDELNRALEQVVATAGDAQKNAVAVNNFLTIAVAGVAREAKRLRQDYARGAEAGAVSTGQAGQGIVTQQEIRNKLGQEVGINANQIEAMKKLDPASKQAMAKLFGVQI
jgi:hypothetical protein